MRGTAEVDPEAAARLARLGRSRAGPSWVPDQPGLDAAAAAAGPAARVEAGRTAGGGASELGDRLRQWVDEVTATASAQALVGLGVICAVCVAVTAWVVLHHPSATAVAFPARTTPLAAPLAAPTPTGIVIDVGGRVRRPGLVTLSPGARVADALRAVGGALRPRDTAMLDLAARVSDGQLLLIGVAGAAGPGGGSAGAGGSSGPVDLNVATVDQLDALPGIGPVLAQRIVDWRTAHGGFRTVDDLNEVSGIGDSIFAELAPLVRV
jgi:competence protein ComEA